MKNLKARSSGRSSLPLTMTISPTTYPRSSRKRPFPMAPRYLWKSRSNSKCSTSRLQATMPRPSWPWTNLLSTWLVLWTGQGSSTTFRRLLRSYRSTMSSLRCFTTKFSCPTLAWLIRGCISFKFLGNWAKCQNLRGLEKSRKKRSSCTKRYLRILPR